MSEEQVDFKEVISLAEEAQKRGKFNLADAIKGRSFPEKAITVFTDAKSALELKLLNDELNDLNYLDDTDKYNEIEKKANSLAEEISKSKLVFKMRGIDQDTIEEVTKGIVDTEITPDSTYKFSRDYACALVAANILSVENADGELDERVFTLEDGIKLYQYLPAESWSLLVKTMEQLTLATGVFKGITDAGFLPKS